MQKISHKRGDTFIPSCTFLGADGMPGDYSGLGIVIKSQVRTPKGELVANLAMSSAAGLGNFTLESGSTQNWPLGSLRWDIQFTQGGHIFSTQSAELVVSDDVTV